MVGRVSVTLVSVTKGMRLFQYVGMRRVLIKFLEIVTAYLSLHWLIVPGAAAAPSGPLAWSAGALLGAGPGREAWGPGELLHWPAVGAQLWDKGWEFPGDWEHLEPPKLLGQHAELQIRLQGEYLFFFFYCVSLFKAYSSWECDFVSDLVFFCRSWPLTWATL